MHTLTDQTRDRILQAALEIFADRGFKDATVRDICAKAGVNAASVNYYFRSKEALYTEALAFAFRQAEVRYPLDLADAPDPTPEARLEHFIRTLLRRITDDTDLGWHGKLIAREIVDPTGALDRVVDIAIRPAFRMLRETLPRILGPGWSPAEIDRCIHSILGQCLMYRHSRSITERICPDLLAGPDAAERTANFVVAFTLAALRGLAHPRSTAS
jgi:AcrR family transcriptional regulator